MRVLAWLDQRLEYTLSFLFYSYLASIIFIEVVRRYVFNASSSWGEETAVYAFIWMTYIAAARGVKQRSHLSVSILVDRLGRRGKFASMLLSDVCFFALAVVVFYYSLILIPQSIEFNQTMRGLNLPIALATAGVPIGWFLIAVRVVQRSVVTVKAYRRDEEIQTAGMEMGE